MYYLKNIKLFDCPECGYTYRGSDANIYNHWLKGFRRGECPGCNKVFEYEPTQEQIRADRIGRLGMFSSMAVILGIMWFADKHPTLLLLLVPTLPPWLYGAYIAVKAGIPKLRRVRIKWRDND